MGLPYVSALSAEVWWLSCIDIGSLVQVKHEFALATEDGCGGTTTICSDTKSR